METVIFNYLWVLIKGKGALLIKLILWIFIVYFMIIKILVIKKDIIRALMMNIFIEIIWLMFIRFLVELLT